MLVHLFRSLTIRDFRVYYLGQLVSITGTWMQTVAQAWLVYRLSESSLALGIVGFVGLLPVLLFGLAGGVLADRYSRRNLLVIAQLIALLQAFTLSGLAMSGNIATWHIFILAFVLGMVHAFEMPTRHSFIAELVPRPELSNAIALNSSVFNLARFLGPALAGWLVALFNEGFVFFINGWSFLIVLIGLLTIRGQSDAQGRTRRPAKVTDAIRFAWGRPPMRAALMLLAASSLLGTSYSVLMPVFATKIFEGGAEILGALLGAAGGGALIAALRLAYLSGRQDLSAQMGSAALVAGAGMVVFALNDAFWLALLLLATIGFALTTLVASANTLIQLTVDDATRGRVMALFSVLFIGSTSLGSLLTGFVANRVGAPLTVLSFGALAVLAGLYHYWYSAAARKADTKAIERVGPSD